MTTPNFTANERGCTHVLGSQSMPDSLAKAFQTACARIGRTYREHQRAVIARTSRRAKQAVIEGVNRRDGA